MAFFKCEKLTSVTIQGSGVAVGGFAFSYCTELTELVIPDGENVLIAGEYSAGAFFGCKKLPLAMRAKLKAWGFKEP